jgi:small subunit ribosomal protein S20
VANIKSQIKRNRTNEAARLRNKSVKSSLKTAVRKVRTAAEAGDKTAAEVELKAACRSLDSWSTRSDPPLPAPVTERVTGAFVLPPDPSPRAPARTRRRPPHL